MRIFFVALSMLFFIPTTAHAQSVPKEADCNNSCRIDLGDYNVVISRFGNSVPSGTFCDVDKNGTVGLSDYNAIVGFFGQSTACANASPSPIITLTPPPTQPPSSGSGIWIDKNRLAQLPTSGPGWEKLVSDAQGSAGTPDLSNQDDSVNVKVMAKAIVYARTGNQQYLQEVKQALQQIVQSGTYNGRALALGRELAAYVISADLIDLKTTDPSLDSQFRNKIRELLRTPTSGGPSNLVECHEDRPNNWGTMCGGSRIAVAAYLNDTNELNRAAQVFQGWTGHREVYAHFSYGSLSWQCDEQKPVGINKKGCTKNGLNLEGSLPDDNRRCGNPMCTSGYAWEGQQGSIVQGIILHQMGYPSFQWGEGALCRAATWTTHVLNYPASSGGDDVWTAAAIDYYCGTHLWDGQSTAQSVGKISGHTFWTHQ